jgi:hypothetical protein
MRAGASHETVGLLSLNGSPHEINAVGLSVGGLHIPCHFHVHDVHEVHSCFDLIPLCSFFSAELGFDPAGFLHRSQPSPNPSSRNWLS